LGCIDYKADRRRTLPFSHVVLKDEFPKMSKTGQPTIPPEA